MTEEFRIYRTFGNGTAVDGKVFLVSALASVVNDARENLFAHAVLAHDEYGEVYWRHLHRHLNRTIQPIAVAHDAIALLDGLYLCGCHGAANIRKISFGGMIRAPERCTSPLPFCAKAETGDAAFLSFDAFVMGLVA